MIENPKVSLFNRKGKLYIQYYINGRCVQKSLKRDYTKENIKLAKKYVIPEIERKILLGEIQDNRVKPKEFEYYATIYLRQKENLKSYYEYENIVVNQLFPLFKHKKVNEITKGEIKEWVDKRLNEITSKRLRNILNILIAILDIAVEYEHIQINPAKNIKLPSHKKIRDMKPFNEEEVKLLINNAKGQFKCYLAIAFYTGMRPGEIIALTISDINLKEMYINVNKRIRKGEIDTPKTKNSLRKVPIFQNLKPYLEELIKKAKENKTFNLFTTKTGKRYYSSDKLHPHWYDLLQKCNIEKRVMYNTRHTFATLAIKRGVPIFNVSQILGHRNTQETLETYAKFINNEHLQLDRNLELFTDSSTDSVSKKA
ncbi:tyrosine-type recombinase/integrase [Caminibacter pacificus]|uniref:Integrase n=1 Tax=Caminibacter pacificus TaxID=1424653 RepID=A0AAJ4RDB0_9BACT|nr:site-specific integrase [Caminibacter pacificus]QCI27614.1 site-specific integrase [Caminibacter pacificus]ROR40207.1 integrase [Caminibacter pacificus]